MTQLTDHSSAEDFGKALCDIERFTTFRVLDACFEIVQATRLTLNLTIPDPQAENDVCMDVMDLLRAKAGTGLATRWRMPMLTQQWMYEQFQTWANAKDHAEYLARLDQHLGQKAKETSYASPTP